ncbi:S1 RNA-binding domain-containing protein 1 [Pseudolycoriella hygida]|uniref:S1 RNA-binding domain-containing protein 1 n=1 Tax=Pseudolycoriella hygida TaxID=35572 RepID=A0A9Q0MVQ3_9DIPT|nr:S1 RNA-binding domain-containing protein 1 [Pseudolycoriella hygida]
MLKSKRKCKESSSEDEDEIIPKKGRKAETKSKSKRLAVTDYAEVPEKRRKVNDSSIPQSSKLKSWDEAELLSEKFDVSERTMGNIVRLLQEDNTIPFMCRYRKDLIGNMTPDKMRDIKFSYNQLVKLKVKQEAVITKLSKMDILSDELQQNILTVKSSEELDHLYEPFKTSKTSLAERAKSKGLQDPAENILFGRSVVQLNDFVDIGKDLANVQSVREGVKNIILNIINKDVDVLEEIRRFDQKRKLLSTE